MNGPSPPFATFVTSESWLLNSLPSGIVLFGSTKAWLTYSPGTSGANTRIRMWRVTGAPPSGTIWPASEAPEQVTTPEASGPLQVNACGEPGTVSRAWRKPKPAGRRSVTVTPETGSLPRFVTAGVDGDMPV